MANNWQAGSKGMHDLCTYEHAQSVALPKLKLGLKLGYDHLMQRCAHSMSA